MRCVVCIRLLFRCQSDVLLGIKYPFYMPAAKCSTCNVNVKSSQFTLEMKQREEQKKIEGKQPKVKMSFNSITIIFAVAAGHTHTDNTKFLFEAVSKRKMSFMAVNALWSVKLNNPHTK